MNKLISTGMLFIALVCSACGDQPAPDGEPCADEFYEGTVIFPDGTTHHACSPARSEGIAISFVNPLDCRVQAAVGAGDGTEAGWEVGAASEWFNTSGSKDVNVVYQPNNTLHPSFCPLGPSYCAFRNAACRFEVTRAASAVGDMVEGHLIAPCVLLAPPDVPAPTITSMRFRAHLSAQVVNDAGATCAYP